MFSFAVLSVAAAILTSLAPGSPKLLGLGLAALVSWAVIELASMGAADRRPRLALVLLMLLNLGFWLAFGRLGRVLLALVDARGGLFGVSPASLELVLAAGIVAVAPLWCGLWVVLRRAGLEPSPVAKFSLAFVILALGCFCLGVGLEWSLGLGPVGPAGLGLALLALALAAACLGPAGLEAIAELEQPGDGRAWLALWLFGCACASASTSWTGPGLAGPFEICLSVGYGCVIAGVGSAFAWRPLAALRARRAHGRQPRDWATIARCPSIRTASRRPAASPRIA